ncbi:MAG: hypothetical protein GY945_09405 [Rhodobacteraceae bacterium]|nr:hypothetical protein [Paracoccaceae bacterium]
MRNLIIFLLILPNLASAQDYFTALEADLTGDGISDRAELAEDPGNDSATLKLFVGQASGEFVLHMTADELVWLGSATAGQQPELAVSEFGSLRVTSMNEAIGRNRWHEVLTIAYRQDTYKIAGYTHFWYDTLDLEAQGMCDISLLTGKGEMTLGSGEVKTPFRTDLRAMPVANWIREIPAVCLAAMN